MAKKIVKKKKLKVLHFLLLLLILIVIVFAIYLILNTKIKNIIITGNNYIKDEQILTEAKLTNYPPFFLTLSSKIKTDLQKNPAIKEVKVRKKFFNVLEINLKEYKVVLKKSENKYILENIKELTYDGEISVPRLTNDVPNNKYKELIENMANIKSNILEEMSEIKYVPNEYDKDRFLIYMDDGNSVYLTLTKFEMINYYNRVLPQLENRKGILYLDSGNHFKIME